MHGLFAVLLVLMVQLGIGASVPRLDAVATAGVLCHAEDDAGGMPSKAPFHPAECLLCPLCVALHASPTGLVAVIGLQMPLDGGLVVETELPPPSRAPPTPHRPARQPRAPPTLS